MLQLSDKRGCWCSLAVQKIQVEQCRPSRKIMNAKLPTGDAASGCFVKTFFYSIELRKCGVCRQRKSSGARRKTECSWWPCMKNWFSSWNSMLPWGQGWAFLPWNKPKACWRAKMPTPARRAAYCWVRKTSAECRATKYWRYFSIAKELSLSKYTSFPWFYWIRDFVTLQNTVFLIAKSGKEIKFLSPCYARRKRKKLGTHKQLQEGKRCCKVTNDFVISSAILKPYLHLYLL